jgi:hypothetical protein
MRCAPFSPVSAYEATFGIRSLILSVNQWIALISALSVERWMFQSSVARDGSIALDEMVTLNGFHKIVSEHFWGHQK